MEDNTMANKLYVAYGSNLNLAQMAKRCPNAKVVGCGELKDYQLTFCGVATIIPKTGAKTLVGVWEITPKDERNLDIYEGYPSFYRKETVEVTVREQKLQAMVYIKNDEEPMMPYQGYYDTILQGYKDVGLDPKALQAALDDTERRMKKK